MTARWSVPDPAAVAGTPKEIERAFFEAFTILDRWITLLLALPLAKLERQVIRSEIERIGGLYKKQCERMKGEGANSRVPEDEADTAS